MPETLPTNPVNAYGNSKLAVDRMISDECRAHGLGAVSLRYFNVAGASGDARRGPRARDAPDPARPPGRRRQARARLGVRHRLPDRGRHRGARLHPHRGPRRGPHPRRSSAPRTRASTGSTTSATAPASPCARWSTRRARSRAARSRSRRRAGAPATRRAGGVVAEDPRRARLGPAQARDRDDDRRRLGVVRGPPRRLRRLKQRRPGLLHEEEDQDDDGDDQCDDGDGAGVHRDLPDGLTSILPLRG